MQTNNLQDKCRGSLIGGAIGDALGYAVEFSSLNTIHKKYGVNGISDYDLNLDGIAEFSDDTQMSLFTAQGMLSAMMARVKSEEDMIAYLTTAYIYWYDTQIPPPIPRANSWLSNYIELWNQRAPENTCMEAMAAIWDDEEVYNNSKGCGGVIRVAPIGVFSAAHPELLDLEHTGYLAGQAAYITHKHPLSTYSSMALAMIVADCIAHDEVNQDKFRFIVINRVFKLLNLHFKEEKGFSELQALIQKSLELAVSDKTDTNAIRELGKGWMAEETLAIAVFSVMRYIDDFEKCIRCAVNHDGDSDSTGAVAGNIIGAILGYQAIPEKYLTNLEFHRVLLSVADDLGGFSSPGQMKVRYLNPQP